MKSLILAITVSLLVQAPSFAGNGDLKVPTIGEGAEAHERSLQKEAERLSKQISEQISKGQLLVNVNVGEVRNDVVGLDYPKESIDRVMNAYKKAGWNTYLTKHNHPDQSSDSPVELFLWVEAPTTDGEP